MARGRMLNRTISTDKRVAELDSLAGPYGTIFFTWLIAHLDREGRICADPDVLHGAVVPRLPKCTVDVVRETLEIANALGLIDCYEANGDHYLTYPKFRKNQKGLRVDREPESDCPPPGELNPPTRRRDGANVAADIHQAGILYPRQDGAETAPNIHQDGGLREEKRREVKEKGREDKGLARVSVNTPASRKVNPEYAKEVMSIFDAWRQRHPDEFITPHSGQREWMEIERRLFADGFSVLHLTEAIDGIHVDPWQDRARNLTLMNVVKSGEAVQRFRRILEEHGKPKLDEKTARTMAAGERFLNRERT